MFTEMTVRAQLYEWDAPGYNGIVYFHPDDCPYAYPDDIEILEPGLTSRWAVGSTCRPEEATSRIKIRVWTE